jgi:hypothetical protein
MSSEYHLKNSFMANQYFCSVEPEMPPDLLSNLASGSSL